MYRYRAELLAVIDGDTLDLRIDLGFHLTATLRFRLLEYDAPEMHGETLQMGRRAKQALEDLLRSGELEVATEKGDSFGRWLCDIVVRHRDGSETDVVQDLIQRGYGRAWDGRGKRPPWDPRAVYP